MSGIAEVLLNLGYTVSGSDLRHTPVTERLVTLGARIAEGHTAENLGDAEVVVTSTAVAQDNPEVIHAKHRHVPVIPRAEMLAELMRLKFNVAVAGSHGKTTVTSMVAVMLSDAGLDPTAVVGGRLDVFGSSARLGKSDLMVVEADESDRSFLLLLPSIAVVTNIDREHLDHYKDLDEILGAFLAFANRVPFYGAVIGCIDAPWGERFCSLIPKIRRRVTTYALDGDADVRAIATELNPGGSVFEVYAHGKNLGRFQVRVPGRHNVQNALATIAVGLELELSVDQVRSGLDRFRGVDRRFQIKADWNGITVIDDYGHHPAEIRAVVDAARLRGARRIRAVFQPHRYTRTHFLMDDFSKCFEGCERVYVLDIYAASEPPIPGVTSERLVERMRELGLISARYAPSDQAVIQEILAEARPGDIILTVGAGSVWKVGEALGEALRKPQGTASLASANPTA